MADYIQVDATEALEMFKRLQYNKVVKKKNVRALIRLETKLAQKAVMDAAKASMGDDPRKAHKAVKLVVYKDANGAMVNLYDNKAAKSMTIGSARIKGGISGITRKRKISDRTKQINAYQGKDRAFILRFINQGTGERFAGKNGGMRTATRGIIQGKNFFRVAPPEMQKAGERLGVKIKSIIEEVANNR